MRCQYDWQEPVCIVQGPTFLDIPNRLRDPFRANFAASPLSWTKFARGTALAGRGEAPALAKRLRRIDAGTIMVRKLILSGLVAAGLAAGAGVAAAQSSARAPGVVIQEANALRAQIHRFHAGPGIWMGYSPPPVNYCRVLSTGELVLKELVYLANRAIQYGPPSLVAPLQRAADGLGDELDHEEEINNQAGFNYGPNGYPCPAPNSPFAARAAVLVAVNQRMPGCRIKANALRLTAGARRNLMQQCLRVIP